VQKKNMKNYLLLLGFVLLFFIFNSCKDKKSETTDYLSGGYSDEQDYSINQNSEIYEETSNEKDKLSFDDEDPTSTMTPVTGELTTEELQKIGKKIIKNGNLSLDVEDYIKSIRQIKDTIKTYDCYISNENEANYDNYITNTLIIRVKASQFDSLLNAILSEGGKVTSKSIVVEDVTGEYVDVYQRLKNKKSVEKQYLELLKKAYSVNDVIYVTENLRRVQEEIEASIGRLKLLDDQADYSTLSLTITYRGKTEIAKDTLWSKILEGLEGGWQGVLLFVVAVFYLWPIWIVLTILFFIIKRQIKKSKIKSETK
jgi:hypothetical protein